MIVSGLVNANCDAYQGNATTDMMNRARIELGLTYE